MAPAVFDDTLYVSTVPGNTKSFYKGNGAGVLFALDAETGGRSGSSGRFPRTSGATEHTDINSGGGLWHPPAFDDDGDVYVAVANPAPWPGTKELPVGVEPPGAEPLHEQHRQARPGKRRGDLASPGPPARRVRLGPAAAADPRRRRRPRARRSPPASWATSTGSTPKTARSSGSAPSAGTTATTRTTRGRSRATTKRCRSSRSRSCPASSAASRPRWPPRTASSTRRS